MIVSESHRSLSTLPLARHPWRSEWARAVHTQRRMGGIPSCGMEAPKRALVSFEFPLNPKRGTKDRPKQEEMDLISNMSNAASRDLNTSQPFVAALPEVQWDGLKQAEANVWQSLQREPRESCSLNSEVESP